MPKNEEVDKYSFSPHNINYLLMEYAPYKNNIVYFGPSI